MPIPTREALEVVATWAMEQLCARCEKAEAERDALLSIVSSLSEGQGR
jgi:hypothetical protein